MFRISKTLTSVAYLLMIWITWRWIHGRLDMQFSIGCLLVSGLWLALTHVELKRLLRTYFDILSRLQMWLPITFGYVTSALAFFTTEFPWVKALAVVEALYWSYILFRFQRNKRLFQTLGHGPLPEGTWVNPPADALEPGDVILTSGRIATRLQESVGHGEIILRLADGKLYLFSSYMDRGAVIDPAEAVLVSQANEGIYIANRARVAWSDEDNLLASLNAQAMVRENVAWRENRTAWWNKTINSLPVPKTLKTRLLKKVHVSGYDWLGLYMGRRSCDHWTCIAACQELLWRMGRVVRWLGTGLLGLGTGLFDPIMPDRFLAEPTYRPLTLEDKQKYEAKRATTNGAPPPAVS